jgi:cell division protease FtsH
VQRILRQAHDRGVELLRQYRFTLDALAAALVEHETLDEEDILHVTGLQHAPRLQDVPTTHDATLPPRAT